MVGKSQELKENEMHKAFKFRLHPTKEQEALLSKHFGCSRFIYNHFLAEKQKHYLENKTTLNFNQCAGNLVAKKKNEEFQWLKEVNSQVLISTLMNLETAYGNFFRKKSKFPRFKSKKNKNSFQIPQHITLKTSNTIQIPKFKEGLKFVRHRELKGEIKSATISKNSSGKYYISVICVVEKPIKHKKTGKNIGIDLGLNDFLITSEGQRYCNPKFLKKYEIKLKRKQKILSRKEKGSKGRDKARLAVAKVHEKITNSRNDMQHKVSTKLVRDYDLIAIEDLNVKGMVKNHKLAKAISDVAWSSFVSKLKYKAQWYGREVIVIDRFYPSSKTCSCCDHVKESLSLKERTWTCSKCNTIHDRDVNASKNILRRSLASRSTGTVDNRNGAKIRPKEISKVSRGTGVEVLKKKGRKYYLEAERSSVVR
jgi:putative transposase